MKGKISILCYFACVSINIGNEMSKKVRELAEKEKNRCVMVSAQVEAELASLEGDDRKEFLEALGVDEVNYPISFYRY